MNKALTVGKNDIDLVSILLTTWTHASTHSHNHTTARKHTVSYKCEQLHLRFSVYLKVLTSFSLNNVQLPKLLSPASSSLLCCSFILSLTLSLSPFLPSQFSFSFPFLYFLCVPHFFPTLCPMSPTNK